MMNELFLYDRDAGLFKAILNQSTVIQGRYFIMVNGNDINAANLGQYISDALNGLQSPAQKYPCAICLPPRSSPGSVEGFSFVMFFLTKAGITGQNKIKDINLDQQVSMHPAWYDWKDMNECAKNFLSALSAVLLSRREIDGSLINGQAKLSADSISVTRISNVGNDNVNGVRVSFDMMLRDGCELQDYPEDLLERIALPDANIHPLHKH